jgi:hypothetical protein
MLGSSPAIFEIVTGQILLARRQDFLRYHKDLLLPMLRAANIEPVLCLLTELGRYGRFLDIYRYPSLEEYGKRTDAFLKDTRLPDYYAQVGTCIEGSISVELALEFPHFSGINQPGSTI